MYVTVSLKLTVTSGTNGSVAFLFTKRGEISFEDSSLEDQVMEVALEAGAEDIEVI